MSNEVERYNGLDGIRVLAMLGIVIMHILANLSYKSELLLGYRYIAYFGEFTVLFMMISGFSVSCGYYKRISEGGFDTVDAFYAKRYIKLLPFFAFLTLVDIILSPSIAAFYEGIANITLGFGLIPHESITVIGVGWTLGVIFVFYMLYPFFVFCMRTDRRFILLLLSSLFFAFVSNEYFKLEKVDFIYCMVYFVIGCGLYLKRKKIKQINRWIGLLVLIVIGGAYFYFPYQHNVVKLCLFTVLCMYAIIVSNKRTILKNKVMKTISNYSFEMYLCHMVAFRIVERLRLTRVFSNAWASYVLLSIMVLFLSFFISWGFKKIQSQISTIKN